MAKGTGTYDDPIIVDGIFSKTINGVKKFFKLNGNSSGSADHSTTSRGQIAWFAQTEVPNGYLVCNGANVSRTTYADLFNAIGTTFGSGDGSNTFALPNLIDKFAQGSTTVGVAVEAGLPNITGLVTSPNKEATGCLIHYDPTITDNMIMVDYTSSYPLYGQIGFDASRSSSIYGNSTTVQPPALNLLPCIKY